MIRLTLILSSLLLLVSCIRTGTYQKSDLEEVPRLAVVNQQIYAAVSDFLDQRGLPYEAEHDAFVLAIREDEKAYNIDLKGSQLLATKDTSTLKIRISEEGHGYVSSYIENRKEMFLGYFIYKGHKEFKDIPFFVFSNSKEPFFSLTDETGTFDFLNSLQKTSIKASSNDIIIQSIYEPVTYAYEFKNGKVKFIGVGWDYSLFGHGAVD